MEKLPGGFGAVHDSVHGVSGLWRADLNGKMMTMGYATDFSRGGLSKILQTFRSNILQKANSHKAAVFIRENINEAELYVIEVTRGAGNELIIRDICRELRKRYGLKIGKLGISK
ncbi:hypothetical protein [Sphingomonas japonica]|uniref:Uncharacterized protein n=2 Tax=Sphingomonas japonica TaxID=511662 RepID=A0ABX0U779_9SPHN|nr:hypothetical protein [Sphingomonas japonica]NIJ24633.1 hypothetical protein [Sphingomonas japonica]